MLEKILRMYTMAMAGDVRSPVPHLFGPPGSGKSTVVQQAADLLGVKLHVINVSRISPLELEGVQMPDENNESLRMLTATFWTQLKPGDIVLWDEFLRGFPEVFNGLLDIMTSHQVGQFRLPRVFFMAASNSVVAYDKALEDRLLHIPVADPRKNNAEKRRLAKLLVNTLGLLPTMAESSEMADVMDQEILPTFDIMDQLKNRANVSASAIRGHSIRNLIGQAQLREVHSSALRELINENNNRAMMMHKEQYVLLLNGSLNGYAKRAKDLLVPEIQAKLSEVQRRNLRLNLQLVELEEARKEAQDDDGDESTEEELFFN